MRKRLVSDYLFRAEKRIKSLYFLSEEKDYADVVREAQEVVELLLKALLLYAGLSVPKFHDVTKFIEENMDFFSDHVRNNFHEIRRISRRLRKEREIAFYGAEDWIPSEEYTIEDAQMAIKDAEFIYGIVKKEIGL